MMKTIRNVCKVCGGTGKCIVSEVKNGEFILRKETCYACGGHGKLILGSIIPINNNI